MIKRIIGFSVPAIIAASVFFLINLKQENEFIYNKVPNMSFSAQKMRIFDEGINKEKIHMDEYADYTKIDIQKVLDECGLKNKKNEIEYLVENNEIVSDEGLFTSVKGKGKITLRISKEKNYIRCI